MDQHSRAQATAGGQRPTTMPCCFITHVTLTYSDCDALEDGRQRSHQEFTAAEVATNVPTNRVASDQRPGFFEEWPRRGSGLSEYRQLGAKASNRRFRLGYFQQVMAGFFAASPAGACLEVVKLAPIWGELLHRLGCERPTQIIFLTVAVAHTPPSMPAPVRVLPHTGGSMTTSTPRDP